MASFAPAGVPALLSPHLSEAEFIATSHRQFWPVQMAVWRASEELQSTGRRFASSCFERVRELTGPLRVTSGFRCPALNAAVGGVPDSRHMLALAADCIPVDLSLDEAMHRISRALDAGALRDIDKVIHEGGWLHVQGSPVGMRPRGILLATEDFVHFEPWARTRA